MLCGYAKPTVFDHRRGPGVAAPGGGRPGAFSRPARSRRGDAPATHGPDDAGVPGRRSHPRQVQPRPASRCPPRSNWANVPPGTAELRAAHARSQTWRAMAARKIRCTGCVWGIPGSATGLPENVPKGADRPDGSHRISASGPVYRGPGAPATGPVHHYTFELFALDTKLDVPVGADAWVTRAAVWKAMEGHVLGKAIVGGDCAAAAIEARGEESTVSESRGLRGYVHPMGRVRHRWSSSQ